MRFTFTSIATLAFFLWAGHCVVLDISFDRNCGGYFARAATANTIELAIPALERGVTYLEQNDLTSGYTSVLYRTPDEDLGFFYSNMKESLAELKSIKPDASPLERSNVLMKLRETLVHTSDTGDSLTLPEGISRYPSNLLMALWGIGSLIALICGWFVVSVFGP